MPELETRYPCPVCLGVMMEKTPVPGMGWFAQLTDPEGNVFAIWETDSHAAPAAMGCAHGNRLYRHLSYGRGADEAHV